VVSVIDLLVACLQRLLGQPSWFGIEETPRHLNFPFRTDKLDGIRAPPCFVVHPYAIGICEMQAFNSTRLGGRYERHRTGVVHIQRPLHNIEHMCTPISDVATTEIAVSTPPCPFIILNGR